MALIVCPECGKEVSDQAPHCPHCGVVIAPDVEPVAASPVLSHPESAPTPVPASGPARTSGLAVVSLVLGILPVLGVGALLAVIFGHVSLGQIKRSNGAVKGRGMAIAGLVLGYLWIALFVLILAIAALGAAGSTEIGSEYGEPQVSGQLTPAPQNARADTEATGEMAPIVIGQDFDGNEVRIENDGRAKAIALLAHWCPHCQNEVPAVQTWLESGGGVDGVDMYSVATSMQPTGANYPSSEWLEREGWTVPVVVDDEQSSVYRAYGSGGFPFWVFVNSDGTVAVRMQGSIPISELEQVMEALN